MIEIKKEFVVSDEKPIVDDRIARFFNDSDYVATDTGRHIYKRGGGKIKTAFAVSPKDWGCEASVELTEQPEEDPSVLVTVTFQIDTTGQWVTDKEREFWHGEFAGFEAAIAGDIVELTQISQSVEAAKAQNIVSVIVLMTLSIGLTFSACIFSIVVNLPIWQGISLIMAAAVVATLSWVGLMKLWLNAKRKDPLTD